MQLLFRYGVYCGTCSCQAYLNQLGCDPNVKYMKEVASILAISASVSTYLNFASFCVGIFVVDISRFVSCSDEWTLSDQWLSCVSIYRVWSILYCVDSQRKNRKIYVGNIFSRLCEYLIVDAQPTI